MGLCSRPHPEQGCWPQIARNDFRTGLPHPPNIEKHYLSQPEKLGFLFQLINYFISGDAGSPLCTWPFSGCRVRAFAAVSLLRCAALPRKLGQQLRLAGSTRAQWSWGTGSAAPQHVDSFRTRVEPESPAFVGEFLTPRPPGKPWSWLTVPF